MPLSGRYVDQHTAVNALAGAALVATNGLAWFSDVDAGKAVSSLSVVIVGGLSLVVFAGSKWNKSRDEWARERAKTALDIRFAELQQEQEFNAKKVRDELALQAERDRVNQTSLVAQVAKLQESMDEARARVEDANKKLHEQNNKWNSDRLQHSEELGELRERHAADVENFTRRLAEATAEITALRDENRAYRGEISQLLQRVAAMQDQTNQNSRNLKANAVRIEDLQTRTDDLAGKVVAP